ncbi:MAG: diadenosine tetraphosphate hydrolase, partial [Verrucomicrobiae bacterium]|nr:diadenosine tetraphosphate hydrolase [Verrucomicrobiae bacterium]
TGAIRDVSCFVSAHFRPAKLNVAAIGNQVRQLHIHIVGRSPGDPAWPGVVWAFEGKEPYDSESVEVIRAAYVDSVRC